MLNDSPKRVLIVSSHSLFGHGLRSLLDEQKIAFEVVGVVSTVEDATKALETLQPDVVIVDYDDEVVNREAFMAGFVGAKGEMRVVLLSLKEGKEGKEAVVYDRRTMAAAQIEDWLEGWIEPPGPPKIPSEPVSQPRRQNMLHIIIAGVLTILVTLGVGFGLSSINLLPSQASAQAVEIDSMMNFFVWAISFLFSLIVVFMVYSVVVFRRREGETGEGHYTRGNTRLEVLWTILPLGAVLAVSFWGAQVLDLTRLPDEQEKEIDVIASQWSWRFEYPELGIVSNELWLQEGEQVVLRLRSDDVIHSFWVPEFRVKQDALPGGKEMIRELRVRPTKSGDYKVRCAELCGRLHSEMLAPVKVRAKADYDVWVEQELAKLSADPVTQGEAVFVNAGCNACHAITGISEAVVGPNLSIIGQIAETRIEGLSAEEYIRQSILNTNAYLVEGYNENIMPQNFSERLSDEELNNLVLYLLEQK